MRAVADAGNVAHVLRPRRGRRCGRRFAAERVQHVLDVRRWRGAAPQHAGEKNFHRSHAERRRHPADAQLRVAAGGAEAGWPRRREIGRRREAAMFGEQFRRTEPVAVVAGDEIAAGGGRVVRMTVEPTAQCRQSNVSVASIDAHQRRLHVRLAVAGIVILDAREQIERLLAAAFLGGDFRLQQPGAVARRVERGEPHESGRRRRRNRACRSALRSGSDRPRRPCPAAARAARRARTSLPHVQRQRASARSAAMWPGARRSTVSNAATASPTFRSSSSRRDLDSTTRRCGVDPRASRGGQALRLSAARPTASSAAA